MKNQRTQILRIQTVRTKQLSGLDLKMFVGGNEISHSSMPQGSSSSVYPPH